MCEPEQTRRWRPGFPLDIRAVLAPLRRGRGDPTFQFDAAGAVWLAGNTPAGPGTLRLHRDAKDVVAGGWGAGAQWLLEGLPQLLGAADDDRGFAPAHPLIAQTRKHNPGLRLGATGRVWDALLPAILEQKVTGIEAHRSWRELCRRFGTPAPGPAESPAAWMRIPPSPGAVREMPDWEWHRAGVDVSRRRAIRAAAAVPRRMQQAVQLAAEQGGAAGRARLQVLPGIGVWTAAEVAQRCWGDPDAVSIGDFHIPTVVGWALVGRPLDDHEMLQVLDCYAPQRHRAVRYVEASGFRRPRFGPRFSPRDYRAV